MRDESLRLAVSNDRSIRYTVAFPRTQELLRVARYLPAEPVLRLGQAPRLGEALLHVVKEETSEWHWMLDSVPSDELFAESRAHLILPYKILLETNDTMVFQTRIYP